MADQAEKARRRALARWEGEGGPQQVEPKKKRSHGTGRPAKPVADEDRDPADGKTPAAMAKQEQGRSDR